MTISLCEHFKRVIGYTSDPQVDERFNKRLNLFRQIFNTISFHLLADRLKGAFSDLLSVFLRTLPAGSDERQSAKRAKSTLQASFEKIVDFTIPIVEQLYADKKQDLLSDLYTMIVESVISRMLEIQLMPVHKYRKIVVLKEMHRRASKNIAPLPLDRSINHRSLYHQRKLDALYSIYSEVAEEFTMGVTDLLQRILNKRERNAGKHYGHEINNFVTRHDNRQFTAFLQSRNLQTMFDDTEVSIVQPVYERYTHSVKLQWHEK